MPSEEWEFDFRNPPRVPPPESDLDRFGIAPCDGCGDLMHQDDALVSVYYIGQTQHYSYFCGQRCKETWYLRRLNEAGL